MKRVVVKQLIAALLFFVLAFAENSSPIWTFSADGSISAMDTIGDCSDPVIANGGMTLLSELILTHYTFLKGKVELDKINKVNHSGLIRF